MLTHLNNQLANFVQVTDAGPYEHSTLGVPICLSGLCLDVFVPSVCVSMKWAPILVHKFCIVLLWLLCGSLNNSTWTSCKKSRFRCTISWSWFSQVIAAQMKTWFDGMHVYLLKPQVQKHEFCHIPKLWFTLACLWKMFFFMFFSGPLSNSPFDLPCFVRSSSTQDGRT